MWLSRLTLNPLCRFVQQDLMNPYEMHRTIMRAFPNAEQGGPGRVLFRVDATRDEEEPYVLLVQSSKKPDWSRLADQPDYLLKDADRKPYDLADRVAARQRLAFRLRANPTVKKKQEGRPNGQRLGLIGEETQLSWLKRKGEAGGFRVLDVRTTKDDLIKVPAGKGPDRRSMAFLAVQFEGVLEVVDPATFVRTIEAGIGSGKGVGFGLLSIAPTLSD